MSERCWCGCAESTPVLLLRRRGMRGTFPLVRCARCGTEYLRPAPAPEVLGEAYGPAYYGGDASKFPGPLGRVFRLLQDRRTGLLRPFVPPDESEPVLLDVGCGNGNFLRAARRRGYVVEGTELSPEAARRASPEGDLVIHAGELASLGLEPGRYSALTMWHVLEHLPDPLAALRCAHRLVERKGWIFIAVPNVASWQARACGAAWFHRDPPRHLWHFTPRTLSRLLRRAGFAPMRWWHFSLDQNPYGWIQGMLNRRFPQDRLYEFLKGVEPLRGAVAGELALAGLLSPIALGLSLAEALARAGGTVTVAAQRLDDRPRLRLRARPSSRSASRVVKRLS